MGLNVSGPVLPMRTIVLKLTMRRSLREEQRGWEIVKCYEARTWVRVS